jgi:ribosomal 50S subunit-associated protein YjgA (DUF615 family)
MQPRKATLQRLGETLASLTPDQLEQAMLIASKALAIKAKRRAKAAQDAANNPTSTKPDNNP